MSRVRRFAVYAFLAGFALWPAVQMTLVHLHGVNPWKLAGWGMYSAPQLPPGVSILCHTPDEVGVYELRSVHPELQAALDRFLRRRHTLGRLAEPNELGRRALETYPAVDAAEIVVLRPYLDRRTARLVETRESYLYPRSR